MTTAADSWLTQVPCLDMPDLAFVQHVSFSILDRLAADRNLLTTLVNEVLAHPSRMAASRVTLLLNRLSLWEAPDHSFEIRLNMNPRPENQLVPHDHCYAFATHILTGGYVHVVRRRTNGWEGPFTGADLQPAIVTVERPMMGCGMHDAARFAALHCGQPDALAPTAGFAPSARGQGGLCAIDRGYLDGWSVQAVKSVRVLDMTGISDHHFVLIVLSRSKLIEALLREFPSLEPWARAA